MSYHSLLSRIADSLLRIESLLLAGNKKDNVPVKYNITRHAERLMYKEDDRVYKLEDDDK